MSLQRNALLKQFDEKCMRFLYAATTSTDTETTKGKEQFLFFFILYQIERVRGNSNEKYQWMFYITLDFSYTNYQVFISFTLKGCFLVNIYIIFINDNLIGEMQTLKMSL